MDISDVRYRLRDCPETSLDQAERTVATLAEITNFEVRPAGLVLQDENRTMRLALTPDIRLDRRIWTPTAIYDPEDGPNAQPAYQGAELSTSAVRFAVTKADGSTACRPFRAESLRSGLALNVDADSVKYDAKKCVDYKNTKTVNEREIESAFMNALFATASHALRGSELELKDVDGNTLMRLEPQADLVGPTWVVTRLGKKTMKEPVGSIPITVTFDEIGLVFGETGAGTASDPNFYSAFYELPAATRVDVEEIDVNRDVEGRACKKGSKRKATPVCKQEVQLLELLSEVDTYTVKAGVLKLNIGSRTVIRLEPEQVYNLKNAGDLE